MIQENTQATEIKWQDYSQKQKINGINYRINPITNAVIKWTGEKWLECEGDDIPTELKTPTIEDVRSMLKYEAKNEITVNRELQTIQNDTKKLSFDILKKTFCKDATDEEIMMFLRLCQVYNLDPFLKEIFYVKDIGILVARDGYLRHANDKPDFEGINSMAVRKNDIISIDTEQNIIHEYAKNNERGEVVGAWAKAKRKGRGYCVVYVDFAEYKKPTQVWQKYPSAMICKVAEVQCLKKIYALSGTVSDVEMV